MKLWRVWLRIREGRGAVFLFCRSAERHRERWIRSRKLSGHDCLFDPVREAKVLAENAETVQRAIAAREARIAARRSQAESIPKAAARTRRTRSRSGAIEDTLRSKDYNEAESRLREMLKDYPREPRIFFALGQTASLAAMDATDEQCRRNDSIERSGTYRLASRPSPDSDKAIMSRAHESMGRINAFFDNKAEALKEFEER